jgi:hypothetical protein
MLAPNPNNNDRVTLTEAYGEWRVAVYEGDREPDVRTFVTKEYWPAAGFSDTRLS